MGFFERLFARPIATTPQPAIRFGRYSDTYKEDEKYEDWNAALKQFEEGEYLASYEAFFSYLRDEATENVRIWEDNGHLCFEFYQGSKRIRGIATTEKLKASARIAQTDTLHVGIMRRLMERNFSLKYCRFALDEEDTICIEFDTYTLDGSPYKLYYALKELALNADKQDDLLLDEFDRLRPVEVTHLEDLPLAEKEVKYTFIQEQITATLAAFDAGKLPPEQYPGGMAYLLLSLAYKLDYLIKPEGYMMEAMERIHREYFSKDGKTNIQKNTNLYKEFKTLQARSKDDFFKELYRVTATFGITSPENHEKIVGFIDSELRNLDWYRDQGHPRFALAIPTYIVGYSLFNYAMPKPDRDLFHLYFEIIEPFYFTELGFSNNFFDEKNNHFNRRAIRRAIEAIIAKNEHEYPNLNPQLNKLIYTNIVDFAKSYLLLIRDLDMTKRIR